MCLFAGGSYNVNGSFAGSPSCSSPSFTSQQALDYSTAYGGYAPNYAYYSAATQAGYNPAHAQAFMHVQAAQAHAQAQAQVHAASGGGGQAPANLSSTSGGTVTSGGSSSSPSGAGGYALQALNSASAGNSGKRTGKTN